MPPRTSISLSALRQVSLFRTMDDEQLEQVGTLLRERRYRKGEVIFHQGDPGGCLYIVGAGKVRIYLASPDGREVTLRVYARDSAFGEFSVLDGQPRSTSAAAVTEVTTFVLYRDEFMALLRSHFALVERLFAQLVERLRYTTTYSEQLAFVSVPGRVAAALLHLASLDAEQSDPVRLEITQQELASFVSTTREWVNRALRDFADAGIIQVERGAIVLLDRAVLGRMIQ